MIACALLAVPLSAHAGPGSGVPGDGVACGFVSTGTEQVQNGFVQGGPWVAPSPTMSVAIDCIIAMVYPDGTIAQELSRTETVLTPGVAFVPPTPVSYVVPQYAPGAPDGPSVNLEMCTEITFYPPTVPPVYRYDADPNTPGGQCDAARHHPTGGIWVEEAYPPLVDGS
jgi:hypothetical protein